VQGDSLDACRYQLFGYPIDAALGTTKHDRRTMGGDQTGRESHAILT
jgi:hypothetical protein